MFKYKAMLLMIAFGASFSVCAACDLSDEVAKSVASEYVVSKYSWEVGSFEVQVSARGDDYKTVVASYLPISPEGAIILTVECRSVVVKEVSSAIEIDDVDNMGE